MTTLLLARDFPPDIGGVQATLGALAAHWPGRIAVVARRTPGDDEYDRAAKYPVARIPWRGDAPTFAARMTRQIDLARAADRVRREHGVDRVIAGYLAFAGPLAWRWKRRRGTPYVIMTYGQELLHARRSPLRPLWRRVLTAAEAVIVIADVFGGVVHEIAPGAHVVKVPLGSGVEPGAPPSLAEPFRGASLAGRRVLLTVARLVPRKGVDMALRAFARLAPTHPDLVYVVAGDGPDRARLADIASSEGVAGRVVFAGRVTEDERRALYARADAFVMASRSDGDDVEGFGIVFVEAGAFGVPVVGGRSGGVPEAVRDGESGFLADPLDPADIAGKIARILDDRALARRLGDEGRRLASEVFTFEAMTREIAAALHVAEPM